MSQRPEDLEHHECVNFRYQSSGQVFRWGFDSDDEAETRRNNAWMMSDASEVVATVLAAGGGIGILPTYLATGYVNSGTLVPVMEEYICDRSWITALWAESWRHSLNVKAFLTLMREIFAVPDNERQLSFGQR